MKTRIISILCTLAIILSFTILPASASSDSVCSLIYSSNEGHNYDGNWEKPIKSCLTDTGTGYMRVQVVDNVVYVEYINYDYTLTSSTELPAELPVFGAFCETSTNYYLLTGQNNHGESNSVEVYRVTKYDKNWNRLGSCSLYGANTYEPFTGGTARMEATGNYLLIHTCHEMYDLGDGNHHQANVTIEVNTGTMKVTDSYTAIMNINYGYVSHSFNQFLHVVDGKLYTVDHGDAYPREVVLCEYTGSCLDGTFITESANISYSKVSNYSFLDIEGAAGNNETGVKVGGFEVSSTDFICVGNARKMGSQESIRNIFVSTIDRETKENTFTYLTSYSDDSEYNPSNPYFIKLSDNSYVILWNFNGELNYTTVDGTGKQTSEIKTFTASLSGCEPIVKDGNLIWYVSDEDGNVTFITLDPASGTHSSKTVSYGHTWTATSSSNIFECSKCHTTLTGEAPSLMRVFIITEKTATSTRSQTAGTILSETLHPGDSYEWYIAFYTGDKLFYKYYVTTDNPDVISINGNTFTVVGTGTANITVHCTFNSKLDMTYPVTSAHTVSSYTITKAATCTEAGSRQGFCTKCNETVTETIPATGHTVKYTITKAATCTEPGTREGTCSVCNQKIINTIAAYGHRWNNGKCTRCGATEPDPSSYTPGDVNADGKISVDDARLCLRRSVKLENYAEGSVEFLACDVDSDSQVTVADARHILRASVNLESPSSWTK